MPVSRVPWVSVALTGLGVVGFLFLRPDRWSSPNELWGLLAAPVVGMSLDAALTPSLGRSGAPGADIAAIVLRRTLTLLVGALVVLWLGITWDIGHGALGPGFYAGLFTMLLVVPVSMVMWTRVRIPQAPPTATARGWTGLLWYAEPQDPRIWVPKRFGWGWTLNFAHRHAWTQLGLLLLPLAAVSIVAALASH